MQICFSRAVLFILFGPFIWSVHYLFIYSINGVGCAHQPLRGIWLGISGASWIIIAASVFALAAMGVIYLRNYVQMAGVGSPKFYSWLGGALGLLSGLAVVWETLPVLLVPACA